MKKIKLTDNRWVGEDEYPYIIAEIGNNHNGSVKIAKNLIKKAKELGVDAVKFQKKDIETAFSQEMLNKAYTGFNSFGDTYREHKEILEFSPEELKDIKQYCEELKITFSCTPFDKPSVDVLEKIGTLFYKISSFHVTDMDLIEYICLTGKPIILSTGMSTLEEVRAAVQLIRKYTENFALMHCVSCYPVEYKYLNLRVIQALRETFNCPTGYSGHERGTAICAATIMLGACIIERHFTLDRTMKGPDHAASIEPSGMRLVVNRSKYFFEALGKPEKKVLECEFKNRKKFRRE